MLSIILSSALATSAPFIVFGSDTGRAEVEPAFRRALSTSAGSCYDSSTHAVTCNVKSADCAGTHYEPGYVSSRNDCCHCRASCDAPSDSCSYYDDAEEESAAACVDDVSSWSAPVNEPCYNPEDVCVGYRVCCVKTGTCKSEHGGSVSSNADYYEGGCYSDKSSKRTFAPGCGTKVGECNAAYLESAQGATTVASAIGTPAADVTARLAKGKSSICQTWDQVIVKVVLAGASLSDFQAHGYSNPVYSMCPKFATAAGVASGYVACAAAAPSSSRRKLQSGGGVELTATIQAYGDGVTTATVTAGIETNMGTPELATQMLTSDSYPVTVEAAPAMSSMDPSGVETVIGGGLSTPVLIVIIVVAALVALVVLFLVYKKLKGGGGGGGGKAATGDKV